MLINEVGAAGIMVATGGALIMGMAGVIKVMVLGKLAEIQDLVSGLSRDMHRMDLRLTRLEAEHAMTKCRFHDQMTAVGDDE